MWTALEIPSEQAAVEYEDRQQIMATFGRRRARGDRRLPREAPGRVRRLDGAMSDLFDVSGKTALVTGGSRGHRPDDRRAASCGRAREVIVSSRKSADVQRPPRRALRELGELRGDPRRRLDARGRGRARRGGAASASRRSTSSSTTPAPSWGAPLEEFPASGWDKVVHTNVEGVFHLTVALLPRAARRRRRRATRRA